MPVSRVLIVVAIVFVGAASVVQGQFGRRFFQPQVAPTSTLTASFTTAGWCTAPA